MVPDLDDKLARPNLILRDDEALRLLITHSALSKHVTPRYVQTLFEREGTTLSAFVRAQRLARAYGLLADPRNANSKEK